MSCLFQLGDNSFRNLLSWLDFGSICYLDIAVGNVDERLLWLHILQTIDNKAVNEYDHHHSSIRWLIMRGARSSRIRVRKVQIKSGRINDETFRGIGFYYVPYMSRSKRLASFLRNVLRRAFGFNITNGADTGVTVRMHGCPHLEDINLSGSNMLTDVVLRAIAQGCPDLISIDLSCCYTITDIGVSAIAQGCPFLTTINLNSCQIISDIAILAIAQNCIHLKSIDVGNTRKISDIGFEALRQLKRLEWMNTKGSFFEIPFVEPVQTFYHRQVRS